MTSTSSEALTELRSALVAWATTAAGIAMQASAAATAFVAETEAEVRARAAKKAALEVSLRTAKPEARKRLLLELELAAASLERSRRALDRAANAAREAKSLQQRIGESTSGRVPRASQSLGRKLQALADYEGVSLPGSGGGPAPGGTAGRGDYGVPGIADVALEQADFDGNPITDGFHREGANRGDYVWAVEKWESVVRPGVLGGKTREDFARLDNEAGRYLGYRRLGGVYDMFLGDEPIHFERRADGSLNVTHGRHRVDTAKRLGITHLPGRLLD